MKKPTVASPSGRLSIDELVHPIRIGHGLVRRAGDDHRRAVHGLIVQAVVHLAGEGRMSLGRGGAAWNVHRARRRRGVGGRLADAMDDLRTQWRSDGG